MHILDLTIKEIHLALVEKRITPLQLAKEAIKRAKENSSPTRKKVSKSRYARKL